MTDPPLLYSSPYPHEHEETNAMGCGAVQFPALETASRLDPQEAVEFRLCWERQLRFDQRAVKLWAQQGRNYRRRDMPPGVTFYVFPKARK